jgi:hypothetical protein
MNQGLICFKEPFSLYHSYLFPLANGLQFLHHYDSLKNSLTLPNGIFKYSALTLEFI